MHAHYHEREWFQLWSRDDAPATIHQRQKRIGCAAEATTSEARASAPQDWQSGAIHRQQLKTPEIGN